MPCEIWNVLDAPRVRAGVWPKTLLVRAHPAATAGEREVAVRLSRLPRASACSLVTAFSVAFAATEHVCHVPVLGVW